LKNSRGGGGLSSGLFCYREHPNEEEKKNLIRGRILIRGKRGVSSSCKRTPGSTLKDKKKKDGRITKGRGGSFGPQSVYARRSPALLLNFIGRKKKSKHRGGFESGRGGPFPEKKFIFFPTEDMTLLPSTQRGRHDCKKEEKRGQPLKTEERERYSPQRQRLCLGENVKARGKGNLRRRPDREDKEEKEDRCLGGGRVTSSSMGDLLRM